VFTVATERARRRLTAVLAADVAGFSRLMGADEEGTYARLLADRQALIDPEINEHDGRVVKTTGDGLLAAFPSAVEALRCAINIQGHMRQRNRAEPADNWVEFRIGINVGDVIVEGADIFGEAVNIAARLEALAEPGGICVSARVQEDVQGKLDVVFEDLGEKELKNIARPVRVYRIRPRAKAAKPILTLPHKPSIAVLPFNNMSTDPDQEYFADGMVEEIITALSRISWLFVIARNSSFVYKGRAIDVKQAGRELGVRYVLEGSVRKTADRVRISAQLVDALTGGHLWADRFERPLQDIFELQDQVTEKVIGAIAPRLARAEIERARRKPTKNLDAYDYYLRGIATMFPRRQDATDKALRLFYKAIELDPGYSSAYGMAAWCYYRRKIARLMLDQAKEIAEAARLARKAIELGKDDAIALSAGGYVLAYVVGDLENGAAFVDRALALDPNLASAWTFSGWLRTFLGQREVALEHFERAMRLSPLDPFMFSALNGTALVYFLTGNYEEATSWATRALQEWPDSRASWRIIAASNALAGRMDEAKEAIARLREADPTLRLRDVSSLVPLRAPADLARYEEGLRQAGLPD